MGGQHFSSTPKSMTSITHFPDTIPEYARKGKENYFPPIFGCSCCPYEGKLHRHGFYSRNVLSFYGHHTIFVARKICPVCGQTYSQIPDFLIPYFQYSYQVIFHILISIFLKKLSILQVLTDLQKRNSLFLSRQHISFYRKRFIQTRFMLHLFFAYLLKPQLYYDMDYHQLTQTDFLTSIASKIDQFSLKYGNFNLTYANYMPQYFFSPLPGE